MGLKTVVVCDRCGAETDNKYFHMSLGTETHAQLFEDKFLCPRCFAEFDRFMNVKKES